MGGRKAVPRARHFSRTGALRLAPALNPDAFVGAVQFYDAGEDDARMVAVLARTAAAYGAALATNVRMDGLLSEGGRGRIRPAGRAAAGAAVQGRAHRRAAGPHPDGHRAAHPD